jgi:pyruvate,water dikinase
MTMGSVSAVVEAQLEAGMDGAKPIVCWFEEVNKDSVALVGGKCSSLGELINAGVRVPPGFALTTHGYAQFMRDAGIQSEITALLTGLDHQDMDKLEEASRVIREMIESRPMSIELEDQIAESYRKLSVRSCIPAVPVAVRSSATAEDLPGASFAGQQDTYLWIRGIDSVMHHVRRCISSLYTGRAIAYRMKMGFPHEQVAISVGIQKMANSLTAGVMFTIHPTNGDRSVIVIDSNFGFGESVVSGEVTPDHFVVNKVALDIMERTISTKTVCYTVDFKEQKSVALEVPFERQNIQSIVDDEITELAWMGKQIEKHYGRPMDIEWAIDKDLPSGGNIFILQARPETIWAEKARSTRQRRRDVGDGFHRFQPDRRQETELGEASMIVRNWMQANPMVVSGDTLLSEAKRILTEHNLHGLPVVDGGRLRGLITRANCLRAAHFALRTQNTDELNFFSTRLKVKDLMVRNPTTIDANDTMEHCLQVGQEHGVGAVAGDGSRPGGGHHFSQRGLLARRPLPRRLGKAQRRDPGAARTQARNHRPHHRHRRGAGAEVQAIYPIGKPEDINPQEHHRKRVIVRFHCRIPRRSGQGARGRRLPVIESVQAKH